MDVIKVYSPDSELKHPVRLFHTLISDLWASRELAWRLFVRNISAQYRQSLLGYFWAFIPPIATTAIWVFLNSQHIVNVTSTNVPYTAFIMIGTLLWQTFVDSFNMPIRMVVSSKSILIKINFPKEALILAGVAEVLFNFLIRLVLIVVTILWFNIHVTTKILFMPLGVLSLIGLGTMVGVLLSPLGALYNDIEKAMMTATTFLFFLTPIAYTSPRHGIGAFAMRINPVSPLLVTTRDWIIEGPLEHLESFYIVSGVTIILLVVVWIIFRISLPHLIARMGA